MSRNAKTQRNISQKRGSENRQYFSKHRDLINCQDYVSFVQSEMNDDIRHFLAENSAQHYLSYQRIL